MAHVRAVVEQQDRVRADDRPQDPVRLARVQQLRIAREDLLDRRGSLNMTQVPSLYIRSEKASP
jgi:hypothetical protein